MQQQNQKTHHERKRQYVKSRADEPLEKPDQQRQKRTLDAKAAQHRTQRQHQTHARADLAPDGRLGLRFGFRAL